MFGTAMRSSGPCSPDVTGGQDEKAQKFMVLTSSRWSSHGCGLVSGDGSSGSLVLMACSSCAPSFQTTSRLSLPCLLKVSTSWQPRGVCFWTYVMMLSSPQPDMPSIALVCALHTARGLMIVRSQTTTKPSASPVTRRSLRRMKAAAWT